MNEDYLHYLWRFKKLPFQTLKTCAGEPLHIIKFGYYNTDHSGPDFKEALIQIGHQKWAGHIEMHLKSSDWYAHHHEIDQAYDNVILHVVWEHDVEVFQSDQTILPTLELQEFVAERQLTAYQHFINQPTRFIPCENQLDQIPPHTINLWLERLYIERLASKAEFIFDHVKTTQQHWDQVAFIQLSKSFGLKKNAEVFEAVAQSLPVKLIQQYQSKLLYLEALLLGQAKLLPDETEETYVKELKSIYKFLSHKHQLEPVPFKAEFFRLRPSNFPTLRLAQLAALLHGNVRLGTFFLSIKQRCGLNDLLKLKLSNYWVTHFNFGKESKSSPKQLSSNFINLMVINAVLPFQFAYYSYHKKLDLEEQILPLVRSLPAEKNTIIQQFIGLGMQTKIEDAMQSQALLTLKNNYCDAKRCLNCNFGIKLIQQ